MEKDKTVIKSFGWIGKSKNNYIRKRTDITNLSNIIKRCLEGREQYRIREQQPDLDEEVRASINKSKNLVKYNNKIIYILSLKDGDSTYPPKPFIINLCRREDFYMILAKDTSMGKGNNGYFWVLSHDLIEKAILDSEGRLMITPVTQNSKMQYLPFTDGMVENVEKDEFNDIHELKDCLKERLD